MNSITLKELKDMVSQLNINNEFDNLEVEQCTACCQVQNSGSASGADYL